MWKVIRAPATTVDIGSVTLVIRGRLMTSRPPDAEEHVDETAIKRCGSNPLSPLSVLRTEVSNRYVPEGFESESVACGTTVVKSLSIRLA
jgi:hypothetical protein